MARQQKCGLSFFLNGRPHGRDMARLLIQFQDAASKCGLGRLLANSSAPVALSTVRATGAAMAMGTVSDVIAELYRVDLAPARQTIQASVNLVTALQAQVA